MSYSAHQAVRAYERNQRIALDVIDRFEDLAERVEADRARVAAELAAARKALAVAYLPELTEEALARAETLTGYRGFRRRPPLKAMAREAHVMSQRVKQIEADERYARRTYLVGPMGELTRALEEAKNMLEPWELECAKFVRLTGFLDLLAVGYDTPSFSESFFEPAYWRHWAQGDAICQALGLDDCGDDVLPAWHKAVAPRDRWLRWRPRSKRSTSWRAPTMCSSSAYHSSPSACWASAKSSSRPS